MILTHDAIIRAQKEGRIIIDPFDSRMVSVNSVDIRLGPDLWRMNKRPYRDIYNPKDTDWEKIAPQSVKDFRESTGDRYFAKDVLLDTDYIFVLKSGHFYLGTSLEKIGTDNIVGYKTSIIPKMKAKSTIGRQGLTVALCAGLGDVGYKSRWALEIRVTDDGDVPIAIGTPIGQVEFAEATLSLAEYDGPTRYQDGNDVKFLPKPIKMIRS